MNAVDPNAKVSLLLNSAWQPVCAVTARAAFLHILKERVGAVDANQNIFSTFSQWIKNGSFFENQPVLRSSQKSWPIPTIIVVTHKFFRQYKKTKLSLGELAKIYNYKCQYCLNKFKLCELTIDHILPRSNGGTDDHHNRTLACTKCNNRKGSQFPFFNIKNEQVNAPAIPAFVLNANAQREEWKDFLI